MTETVATPKKRMGRPPKAPEKGRRQNYTFRMSDADRDRIIEAAARSGRSMSEEIEYRIEKSWLVEDTIESLRVYIDAGADAMLGGRHNLDLFVRLSDFIFTSEQSVNKKWTEDAETRERVLNDLRQGLAWALNQTGHPLLSLTDHLRKRDRKFAEVKSRIAPDDD